MAINWDTAHRAMLTQANFTFDDVRASRGNCMQAILSPEQLDIAYRCIKGFYQGLQWADQFGVQGGYIGNRNFRRAFLLEDEYVLGVFENRNLSDRGIPNPAELEELITLYQQKQGNFKTLVVLEKADNRLASSEVQGRQSRFLLDVLYPAIEGIWAKFIKNYDRHSWHKILQSAQNKSHRQIVSTLTECLAVTTQRPSERVLAAIYQNSDDVDRLLLQYPPLQYFYLEGSPFNLGASKLENLIDGADVSSSQLCPKPSSLSFAGNP